MTHWVNTFDIDCEFGFEYFNYYNFILKKTCHFLVCHMSHYFFQVQFVLTWLTFKFLLAVYTSVFRYRTTRIKYHFLRVIQPNSEQNIDNCKNRSLMELL